MDVKTFESLKIILRPYKARLYPLMRKYPCCVLFLERIKRNFIHLFFSKKRGFTKYSIISACYNVEDYVDEFVDSLVKQSLSFKDNVQLILVDDGSTDKTYEKLMLWQSRFPKNIKVLHQNNQGQSVARNLGLGCAEHDWVCFADSDDFFEARALERVDDYIKRNQNLNLSVVSIHLIPYYEEIKGFVDDHPLNFRFYQTETTVPVENNKQLFQMSVNSAFFSKKCIDRVHQRFNPLCKPGFEDALFVNSLMLLFPDSYIAFLREAVYYYRKRERKNSTIDNSMNTQEYYSSMLTEGVQQLLKLAKTRGRDDAVPVIPQQVSLYTTFWYFSWLVDHEERIGFLSDEQKQKLFQTLKNIYQFIDVSTIEDFKFNRFESKWKVGILGCMKGVNHTQDIVVDLFRYDEKNNEVLLSYYAYDPISEIFLINGKEFKPRFSKTIGHTFLSKLFLTQRLVWLPLGHEDDSVLKVYVGGAQCKFNFRGSKTTNKIKLKELKDSFCHGKRSCSKKYENCWLISDRDIQADDNGEHLYRFILRNHPEINAYFLLNRDSHDWDRLKTEGFKLIAYGSFEHREALKDCVRIISSHADAYVHSYFGDKEYPTYVFLQHGVIHNDLHQWLNTKTIDLLVTSSPAEKRSLVENGTKYLLTEKEVKLLGLPRHDNLIKINQKEKLILVMPTWRSYLVGPTILGNIREINKDFVKSKYAIAWGNFLKSEELRRLCTNSGYKVVFFPHVNMQPYLKMVSLPEYIAVHTHKSARIQNLFARASLMITDYSSVAFEMAYLEKSVIYYQFDADEVLNNRHIFSKGYFSYEKNGFGDVVYTQDDLIQTIKTSLFNDCVPEDRYLNRMKEFFPFKDGKCCERCFNAIKSLGDRTL